MKRSELRKIIQEEITREKDNKQINEGLINLIFGNIGKSKAKKVEKELSKDPEYQQLNKDLKAAKEKIAKIKSKYPEDSIVHMV